LVVAAIPAFNEEATIAGVAVGSGRHVDRVLVCDDGSSDMPGEIPKRGEPILTGNTDIMHFGIDDLLRLDSELFLPRALKGFERQELSG
jgi:hypothetical protein